MPTLVLLRHGESEWNQANRFTGWTDVDLTEKGGKEAAQAGQLLRSLRFDFDVAYTSVLKRAIRTLWLVLEELDRMWLPTHTCWQLNERHYGALQGLCKDEIGAKWGAEQLQRWRRSYDVRPPELARSDPRFPGHDRRYQHLRPDQIPVSESLQETAQRLWPCWQHAVAPDLRRGKRVLMVAHGNSLRALIKYLDGLSDREIAQVEVPLGIPIVYELDESMELIRKYQLMSDMAA